MTLDGPLGDFAADHARFEFDDAAYVLGALDAADRAAFEQHLHSCPICQESVADLTGLPPLLERVDVSAWVPESPPDTLLPRLLREVAASRRRRVWRTVSTGLVAACVAALLLVGGTAVWHGSHHADTLALQSVGTGNSNVRATVTLTGSGSATRIRLDCGYHDPASGSGYPAGETPSYRMVVFNRHGQMRDLGSWMPQPGETVQITRASPWSKQNISKIEVADANGDPILQVVL